MTTATPKRISIINRIPLPKEVNAFLEKEQAAMVFQETGCYPVIRGRKQWNKKSSHGDRMLTIKSQQRVAPETMEKARELVMKLLLQPLPLPGFKVGSQSDWGSSADACAAADDKLSEVPSGFVNKEWKSPDASRRPDPEKRFEDGPGYATKQPWQGLPLIDTRRPPLTDHHKDWRRDHRVHDNFPSGLVNKVWKPPDASWSQDPEEWFEARDKMSRKRDQEGDPGLPSDAVPVRPPYNVNHVRHVKQKAHAIVAKREEASYPGPPAAADDELSEVKAKHKEPGLREAWAVLCQEACAVPRNDAWETSCKGASDADELPVCKEALETLQEETMSDDELAEVSAEQTAHPPTSPRRTTQIDRRANSLLASSQDRRQPDEPMHSMAQESATLFCCCFSIFFCILQFFIFVRFVSNIFLFFFGPYAHVLHKEAVSSHRIVWKRGLPWPSAKHGLGYRPFDPKTMLCESQVQAREEGPADEASSSRAEG